MERFTLRCLGFIICLLAINFAPLSAQQAPTADNDKVVVVQKVTADDGTVVIKKKRFEKGESLNAYVKALNLESSDGQHVDIKVLPENTEAVIEWQDVKDLKNTAFYYRKAKEGHHAQMEDLEKEMQSLRISMEAMEKDLHQDWSHFSDNTEPKAFMGVYPTSSHNSEIPGVKITGVVDGTGAQDGGLKGGDIMTAINGVDLQGSSPLSRELAKYSPGDVIDVSYARDGQIAQTKVTLTEKRSGFRYTKERDPCKVFIGVYVGGHGRDGNGVRVSGIIYNTPAAESNVTRGDIILALDDVMVNTYNELLVERNKHNPGDFFTLSVLRDGVPVEVDAQFKTCKQEEEVKEEVEEPIEEIITPEDLLEDKLVIEELKLEELKAFPNPTPGTVNLQFKAEQKPTSIRITDITGKVVYEEDINNFDGYYNRPLNMSHATPGVLSITIRQNNKVFTESVILLNRA